MPLKHVAAAPHHTHLDRSAPGSCTSTTSPRTSSASTPIQMTPRGGSKGGVTRLGHHGIGGTDRREDGLFGSYRWSVSHGELTLTAIRERCRNRRAVWEGAWTRAR
jgi:hypothetical protein